MKKLILRIVGVEKISAIEHVGAIASISLNISEDSCWEVECNGEHVASDSNAAREGAAKLSFHQSHTMEFSGNNPVVCVNCGCSLLSVSATLPCEPEWKFRDKSHSGLVRNEDTHKLMCINCKATGGALERPCKPVPQKPVGKKMHSSHELYINTDHGTVVCGACNATGDSLISPCSRVRL